MLTLSLKAKIQVSNKTIKGHRASARHRPQAWEFPTWLCWRIRLEATSQRQNDATTAKKSKPLHLNHSKYPDLKIHHLLGNRFQTSNLNYQLGKRFTINLISITSPFSKACKEACDEIRGWKINCSLPSSSSAFPINLKAEISRKSDNKHVPNRR